MLALTFASFITARYVQGRTGIALLNPLLVSIVVINSIHKG
jgi:putative effector of murein hydrolase